MVIVFIVALVAISFYIAKVNSPQYKGRRGEARISKILEKLPEDYVTINDVVLSTKSGTTQIDHVVVSKFGVFVIETKNYRGKIFGNDNREQWTQLIVTEVTYARKWYKTYTYVKKSRLYNPVKQSLGHAYHVENLLKSHCDVKVVPIVVFTDSSDITNVDSRYHVVYSSYLLSVIQGYKEECLSTEQVQAISSLIDQNNVRKLVGNSAHVRNVQASLQNKQNKISAGLCPNCGGSLVQRQGKYGTFWGCSNYPRCRFTTK
ncbi:MAG: NERD domain-containing protein [Bacteroidales bacterium]|nr:NERD domain-containing protein [Bacteroidales bacterium]